MSIRLFCAASLIACSAKTLLAVEPSILAAAPNPQPFDHPLVFEPNHGQAPAQVQWIARGSGYQLFFTNEGITMLLRDRAREAPPSSLIPALFQAPRLSADRTKATYSTMKMKLNGGRPWRSVAGLEPTGGTSNYFIGDDPKGWHTGIPQYARLSAPDVYNGIDLVFYSHGGQLEYDFVVAPGADPSQIRMAFEGLDRTRIDANSGDLLLTTAGGGELRQMHPNVYEQTGNRKIEVAAAYKLLDQKQAGFSLAPYDRQHKLVIDPTVSFTTFLAGNGEDMAAAITVDSSGNSYVTGETHSTNFPLISGIQGDQPGQDAFVTKLSPSGTILVSTYWGGSGADAGTGIALDSTGVFVTGSTNSTDFPGIWYAPHNGRNHAFVTKFSLPNGIYSTIVGGSIDDLSFAIALDAAHAAYITGYTSSSDFPTVGPWHTTYSGSNDAFVVKVVPGGSIGASVYLGGSGDDAAWGITVDQSGYAWIAGLTCSTNFPHTSPVTIVPGCNPFVTRFNNTFSGIYFSTEFEGGTPAAIAVDSSYHAYLTGNTYSSNVATTPNTFQPIKPSPDKNYSAFVTELDPLGGIMYSTYLSGATGSTLARAIAVGGGGQVYVAGWTSSTTFPGAPAITPNPSAGFLCKLTPELKALEYTTFLGAGINGIALNGFSLYPQIYTTGYRYTGGLNSANLDAFVVGLSDAPVFTHK